MALASHKQQVRAANSKTRLPTRWPRVYPGRDDCKQSRAANYLSMDFYLLFLATSFLPVRNSLGCFTRTICLSRVKYRVISAHDFDVGRERSRVYSSGDVRRLQWLMTPNSTYHPPSCSPLVLGQCLGGHNSPTQAALVLVTSSRSCGGCSRHTSNSLRRRLLLFVAVDAIVVGVNFVRSSRLLKTSSPFFPEGDGDGGKQTTNNTDLNGSNLDAMSRHVRTTRS